MNGAISGVEVEAAAKDAEAQLLSTGRILAHTKEPDGAGGQNETYVPGDQIPCAIAPVGRTGGQASTSGNRINEATTHIVTFPRGTAVRVVDRAEVDGVVYSVTALRQYGAVEFTRRVECKEL